MFVTPPFGLMMLWLPEDEAIVDDCYEADSSGH